MIRLIAAMDSERGIPDTNSASWQSRTPTDMKYFREKTAHSTVLMGWNTHLTLDKALPGRRNMVVTNKSMTLPEGFELVLDAVDFLKSYKRGNKDIWIIGGAAIFAQTIVFADELYLTRIQGSFNCAKFFPSFEKEFKLLTSSPVVTENNTSYHFEVWDKI